MGTDWRTRLVEKILVGLFLLALGYLGWIGMALRPIGSPVGTSTPLPTPSLTPALFDGRRAYEHVRVQLGFGPRVPGTIASQQARDYIRSELEKNGWEVTEERFTFRKISLVNVVARRGTGPVTLIGAHYDSRPRADRDPNPARRDEAVPGANDGASGVAVLLELARVLPQRGNGQGALWLYFFDGEDSGNINEWPWSVGARYAAQHLVEKGVRVERVLILDMVGDRDQQFYWERYSTPVLRLSVWNVAAQLGYERFFIPKTKYEIIDDHVPFIKRGVPAVDVIDFDYPYWHTTADTVDKVSPLSLERVGRVVRSWLKTLVNRDHNTR